ncbi:MAG TPA: protein-glutamate O-methyltransferase CheR [Streptosporangiaceae bacterium]|nr:protein-glutamate O-methyltransferase CheR [Streptosporangiaceae bacterium]
MNEALAAVAELVRRETGITISRSRQAALQGAIERAAPGLGADGFARVAKEPARHRDLVDRLIDEVTVQETAFLRDGDQLDLIAWHSLASGARSGPVRVWSAACASGEEAYTLALLATEAFAPAQAPVEILGTDVSRAALADAETGRYRERSVRALGPALRQRYFDRQPDGSYLVTGELRRLVRFRRHNLVRDPVPPPGEDGFDVVVCRNVLIYFAADIAGSVVGQLERSLRPNGIIVLGAADALTRTGGPPMPRPARPSFDVLKPATRPAPKPVSRADRLKAAVQAADQGDRSAALDQVMTLISQDPLDAEAQFIHGLVALEAGEPGVAAAALRRALYADSRFAVAAFALGRAYDALSDFAAARRAYEQALRTLDADDDRHELLLQQIQMNDIAAACRIRLGGVG